MQLKDFSLLKEAPDHYVIGHPAGRSMQVPKSGLSEKAHESIRKMAKGGSVGPKEPAPNTGNVDTDLAEALRARYGSSDQAIAQGFSNEIGLNAPGVPNVTLDKNARPSEQDVGGFNNRTDTISIDPTFSTDIQQSTMAHELAHAADKMAGPYPLNPPGSPSHHYFYGDFEPEMNQQLRSLMQLEQESKQSIPLDSPWSNPGKVNSTPKQYADGGQVDQQDDQDQQDSQDRDPAAVAKKAPQVVQSPLYKNAQEINTSLQGAVNAQQAIGEAKSDEQGQAADIQQAYVDQMSKMSSPIDEYQKFQKSQDDLMGKIVSGQIDPNRYFHKLGTGQKIGTAIGLIASGIGSGLTGQENLASKFLSDAINRDMESQKLDQSQSMNLWKMNQERFSSGVAANAAFQNQMLAITNAKMQVAQDKSKSIQEKQNIAMAQLPLKQQMAQNNLKLSIFGHLSSNPGATSPLNPAQVADLVISDPTQKAEAMKEIGAQQEAKQLYSATEQDAQHITGLALNGALSPADYQASKNAFMAKLMKLTGNRYSPETAASVADSILPGNTRGFPDSPDTVQHKALLRKQFFNSLVQSPNMEANGLPLNRFQSTSLGSVPIKAGVPKLSPQDQAAIKWAKDPKSPGWNPAKAQQILKMTGSNGK